MDVWTYEMLEGNVWGGHLVDIYALQDSYVRLKEFHLG